MGLITKILGITGDILHLGFMNNGPLFKNNSSALEIRNKADTEFALTRGATPVGDDDYVTKLYADSLSLNTNRLIDKQVIVTAFNILHNRPLIVAEGGSVVIMDSGEYVLISEGF